MKQANYYGPTRMALGGELPRLLIFASFFLTIPLFLFFWDLETCRGRGPVGSVGDCAEKAVIIQLIVSFTSIVLVSIIHILAVVGSVSRFPFSGRSSKRLPR